MPIRCLMRVDVLRDGRTVRELTFADDGKLEEMARRGGGLRTSETRQMFEFALHQQRGAVELFLTDEQFARLSQPKR